MSRTFYYRRATDMMPPPAAGNSHIVAVGGAHWRDIHDDIEKRSFTGCLKISNAALMSRCGLVLYQGRVTGAIYTSKQQPLCPPMEEALSLIRQDLLHADSVAELYAVPPELLLPFSSLLLGEELKLPGNPTSADDLNDLIAHIDRFRLTATIAVNLNALVSTCFCCFYQGKFSGGFSVERQELIDSIKYAEDLLKMNDTILNAKRDLAIISDLKPITVSYIKDTQISTIGAALPA